MSSPPVPRESFAAALGNVRKLLTSAREVQDPKEVIVRTFQAIQATAEISERLVMSVGALEDKVGTWETAATSQFGSNRPKPLSESKCVGNLKSLGSDKAEFKLWNDKLINAIAQTLGTEWRKFMRNLNKALDQDRKVLTEEEVRKVDGAAEVNLGRTSSENLFYVLVEKTDGDAALRVNSGEPGEGLEAYMRVYLWFAGTTGLALTEKTRVLMHPTPVRHEYEIADALEKWSEQERTLRAHGDDYKLNAAFKVTALRVLMSCKREQFEFFEREARTKHGEKLSDEMFDDLLARVKEYAQQRRLEEVMKRTKGDPMDIGQTARAQDEYWEHPAEQNQDDGHWSYIDALGKGKGGKGKGKYGKATGKGFPRQCYACGEQGHLAYECPKGKGKSKGKGKTLICWNCGNEGHPHWMCPEGKGKGKGKQWGKGQTKGTYAVEADWRQWVDEQEEGYEESGQGLGGGEINEVGEWQVKVSKARGRKDMRPQAAQTTRKRRAEDVRMSNRFGNLEEEGEEESDDAGERPGEPTRWKPTENRWTKVKREADIMLVDINSPQEIGAVTHCGSYGSEQAAKTHANPRASFQRQDEEL